VANQGRSGDDLEKAENFIVRFVSAAGELQFNQRWLGLTRK
jgi:hypothetical protein